MKDKPFTERQESLLLGEVDCGHVGYYPGIEICPACVFDVTNGKNGQMYMVRKNGPCWREPDIDPKYLRRATLREALKHIEDRRVGAKSGFSK